MLAQAQNERANGFQEIMGTYFLACSTPRRQFDVLAHAGLTVSYSKAISDLKGLSAKGLARLHTSYASGEGLHDRVGQPEYSVQGCGAAA
jgi:hypothetical protein